MKELLDLHMHLIGHGERKADKNTVRAFLDHAVKDHLQEIGFTDHDWLWDDLNLPLIREIAAEYPQLKVRVGLEVDYRPEEESMIRSRLQEFPFDYVIGSVHEINGWPFDVPGEEQRCKDTPPDELYRQYFELMARAARSGLFTTLGHFDLIKVFGMRPESDIVELAADALEEVAAHGLALEINTNGRYKPVSEFYPEFKLIKEIQRKGISFTLGSDAHQPSAVGRDLKEAIELLRAVGVKEIVSFEQRRKVSYPL